MEEISCQRKKFLARESNFLPEKMISCQIKKLSVRGKIYCHRKQFLVIGIHILPKKEIYCRRKIFFRERKTSIVKGRNFLSEEKFLVKFSVTERNDLSEEEFYSQMKKFIVTGKNLQLQEEIYCQSEKFRIRGQNLLSEQDIFSLEEEISCQRKTFLCGGGKISCQRMKLLGRVRNFLSEEEISH